MNSKRFLIRLQYLGFRYHGVQKQTVHQSIQERLESAVGKHFEGREFSTRFSSRTDAMVSAEENFCLLMFQDHVQLELVKQSLVKLPSDLHILEVKAVEDDFTLLNRAKTKTYRYYFSHNQKEGFVFAAPLMTVLSEELDIELMKEGAKAFIGSHWFENYSYKPKEGTVFERTIETCRIVDNTFLTANFFPSTSFVFEVSGPGFMRGQVRLMMGALFRLGKHEITLSDLCLSLKSYNPQFVKWMVPSSGLVLHKTKLE